MKTLKLCLPRRIKCNDNKNYSDISRALLDESLDILWLTLEPVQCVEELSLVGEMSLNDYGDATRAPEHDLRFLFFTLRFR